MFSVGDRVGLYEIVAELRAGGMATLFLGRRAGAAGFAKLVAIKVVHEHLAEDPVFVQMFVDEALLSARIQHPNVVHVEELREFEGHHFLVMEYVHGCSLSQLIAALIRRKRRLSPELAIHIAIKVADGLHAAHEAKDGSGKLLGVVHRDVSPQNILLSYQGNVKLINFGVAKVKGRVEGTLGGSIKGKFRYMSPEHAFGNELDRRADVYSLAIVLFEMLTMRRRFDASSHLDLLEVVRHPDVVPPSRHAPDLPDGLDDVVLRAMEKVAENRYETARALRDALVDVNPRAASLHESVLGSLLSVVMADQIVKDRSQLPSNLSGVTVDLPAHEDGVKALETMTLSAEDLMLLSDSGSMDSLDSLGTHRAVTTILPADGGEPDEATVFDPGYVEQMRVEAAEAEPDADGPSAGPPTDPAPPPEHQGRRGQPTVQLALEAPARSKPQLIAAGVALLVGAMAVSFAATFLWLRNPSETAPIAEPTPTASAEPTAPLTAAVPTSDAGVPPPPAEPADASVAPAEVAPPTGTVLPNETPADTRRGRSTGESGRRRSGRRRSSGRRRTGRGRPVASEW